MTIREKIELAKQKRNDIAKQMCEKYLMENGLVQFNIGESTVETTRNLIGNAKAMVANSNADYEEQLERERKELKIVSALTGIPVAADIYFVSRLIKANTIENLAGVMASTAIAALGISAICAIKSNCRFYSKQLEIGQEILNTPFPAATDEVFPEVVSSVPGKAKAIN